MGTIRSLSGWNNLQIKGSTVGKVPLFTFFIRDDIMFIKVAGLPKVSYAKGM